MSVGLLVALCPVLHELNKGAKHRARLALQQGVAVYGGSVGEELVNSLSV